MENALSIARCGLVLALLLCQPVAASEDPLVQRSRLIVGEFGSQLQTALKQALDSGGPATAVDVCKDIAPQLAAQLSRESGAKVRRTSQRFRNPANAPEPWETIALSQFEKSAGEVETPLELYESMPDGSLHYARAILTGPVCLTCHGSDVAPEVSERVAEIYPFDRARGYTLNEVRGAFSISWPAPALDR